MSHFGASKGDYVEITLKGWVVYNAGGFLAITNSEEVVESSKTESQATFNPDHGEFYFDIPEHMIVRVEEAQPYPDGTIAIITLPPSGLTLICDYRSKEARHSDLKGTTYWFQSNSPIPVWVDEGCTVKVLYNPEVDG